MSHGWQPGAEETGPSVAEASEGQIVDALHRYLDATAIRPRHDLMERIEARLAVEPVSTAPRRSLTALAALDVRGVLRGLRQCLAVAFGPGARPLLRLQAVALVLVAFVTVSLGSAIGVAGARLVVGELTAEPRARPTDREPRPVIAAPSPPLEEPMVVAPPRTSPSPHPRPGALTVVKDDEDAGADEPGPPGAPPGRSRGADRAGGQADERRPSWAAGGRRTPAPDEGRRDEAHASAPGQAVAADVAKDPPPRPAARSVERERE